MKDEKANNSNDNNEITDLVPHDALDDIFTALTKEQKDKKRMTFYLYWLFGFPIKTCSKLSGYSESYAYNLVHDYKKKPNLRHKVDEVLNMFPERYKSFCKLRLPQIAEIEGLALGAYSDDPKLAIRQPQLLKQIKQAGGVDLNEMPDPKKPATINIKELLVFHKSCLPDHVAVVEEAEVIDDK
jgi:hypothetical protein